MRTFAEKELFIPVNNGKLFCRTFGAENTPLVVLHGGPGLGHHYLLPQMAELGKFSFAIFYDQRGTGNSLGSDDWQVDPFQTYVNDLDQVRKQFGFEKISLLAHSWGGLLATFYALAFPEKVDKLIYANSVPVSSSDYLTFVKHRSQIVDDHKAELDSIRSSALFLAGDPRTVAAFYRIYFKNYFSNPELINKLNLAMTPQAALNNFRIYNLFLRFVTKNSFDLYEKLNTLTHEALILACDNDVIPINYMEKLHQSVPSSKLVLIKHCGHFPYIDQPNIFFQHINDFL
jgi:proline iminopeptidase